MYDPCPSLGLYNNVMTFFLISDDTPFLFFARSNTVSLYMYLLRVY